MNYLWEKAYVFLRHFGIQQKTLYKEFDNICPDCGRLTRAEFNHIHIFISFYPLLNGTDNVFSTQMLWQFIHWTDYVDELQ